MHGVVLVLGTLIFPSSVQGEDSSQIAVIEADPTILEAGNPFPFTARSLVFKPTKGGYRLTAGPLRFEKDKGRRSDAYFMEAVEVRLPFPFVFFGKEYRTVYAYMHGVVMFERAERPDWRVYPQVFMRQPPLVAALLHSAQRHPAGAGLPDGLYVNATLSDRVVFTWFEVMAAQLESVLNTFQVTLHRDGSIRVAYKDIQYPEGMVGLSSGDPAQQPVVVELGETGSAVLRGSFYEWFHRPEYDHRAVARAFYRTNADSFDALAIYENFPVSHHAVSSYAGVKNDVRGIGVELFDRTAEFGRTGRLQGVLELNHVSLVTPQTRTGMLAHEFGHRWLARVAFMDAGRKSYDLLESQRGSHWCFYFDTRTGGSTERGTPTHSFMFGSIWEERPDGRFWTGGSTGGGYSPLDLYLMGLLPPDSVPDVFYVTGRPSQGPECGVTGSNPTPGSKQTVSIEQIIAAEGPRDPDVTRSPKRLRMAFVLLVLPGKPPTEDELTRLDRLRRAWERDFAEYTRGLATMDTRLWARGERP